MNAVTEIIPEGGLRAYSFETSDDIIEFAKAFAKAQAGMGDVLKSADNSHFKSKYADLGAVVEATLPALNSAGFSVLQPPSFDGEIVRVATLILHESGQWMRSTLALRPARADPHGVGSAITYARRYGLLAMCGVAPEDDDGNAASRADERDHDERARPARSEARKGEKPLCPALKAAKPTIDAIPSIAEVKSWEANNEAILSKLDNEQYVEVMAYLRAHEAKLLASVGGGSSFGDIDEAADMIGRAA